MNGGRSAHLAAARWNALYFLPVVAVAFLLSFTLTCDPDVPWHLKTGQVILERGALLRTNTFASTWPDHPWPNPEWLFQVLIAALHRAGGFVAIGALKVLLTIGVAGALYARMTRRARNPGLAAALSVLALGAMQFRLTERPHLFSYLFFALTLLIAERTRESRWAAWLLPPLFAIWSNIHPELIFGLLALGAMLVGDAIDRRFAPAGSSSRQARLLVPAVLCLPAACLNPEGYHALLFPFLHTFIGPIVTVTEYVTTSPLDMPAFWILALATAATLWRARRTPVWSELFLAAGMALLGALYLRATPYFFLVATPLLHRHAAAFTAARPRPVAQRLGAAAMLAAAAMLCWALGYDRLIPYRWGLGLDESSWYPAAAATAIERHGLPGRLFNLYGVGGYLIYRLYPRFGVFQDGRLQAYPQDFMARINHDLHYQDWPRIVEQYRVNTLLIPREALAPLGPVTDWGLVFWDDRYCVLVRRSPENAALLSKLEYRIFRPGIAPPAREDPQSLAALAAEMDRNQAERREPSPDIALGIERLREKIRSRGTPAVPR